MLRVSVPWIIALEAPWQGPASIIEKGSAAMRLCTNGQGSFTSILPCSPEVRTCAAFLCMATAGIPLIQNGSEMPQRNTKRPEEIARKRATALGLRDAVDGLDNFHVGAFEANAERIEPLVKIVSKLNELLKDEEAAMEPLFYVSVK